MNSSAIYSLIETYVEGWKHRDARAIFSTLATDCIVRESHGPTYRGLAHVTRWVEDWFQHGNTVDRWQIASCYVVGEVAFFEWYFACTVEGRQCAFEGASLVKLAKGKIVELREYRMTERPYDWMPQ